jgi:hypothetical protein
MINNVSSGVSRIRRRHCVLLVVGVLLGSALPAQTPTTRKAAIEPKAVDALRRMGAYLRTLKQFSIHANGTRDEVTASGQKLQLNGTVSYLVRTPNKLRADLRTDRKHREIVYDGKTLTVYAPRMQYYATVTAPPTIAAMIDSAQRRLGIELPIADLFTWGTARDGIKDLQGARYIGPAYIDGADTDHYAFRQADVDWQLWIQRGNTPFPRKVVITTKTEPSQPQYAATMSWNVGARMNDATFAFTPPKNAVKIHIAPAAIVTAARQ